VVSVQRGGSGRISYALVDEILTSGIVIDVYRDVADSRDFPGKIGKHVIVLPMDIVSDSCDSTVAIAVPFSFVRFGGHDCEVVALWSSDIDG
jgi:hypothetical protein